MKSPMLHLQLQNVESPWKRQWRDQLTQPQLFRDGIKNENKQFKTNIKHFISFILFLYKRFNVYLKCSTWKCQIKLGANIRMNDPHQSNNISSQNYFSTALREIRAVCNRISYKSQVNCTYTNYYKKPLLDMLSTGILVKRQQYN